MIDGITVGRYSGTIDWNMQVRTWAVARLQYAALPLIIPVNKYRTITGKTIPI